jgi:HK97 family phage major capsid protein
MPKVAIEELINKINSRDADKGFEGSSYVFDRGADDIEAKPDDAKQYLRMTLTSETPIEDWFGYLILDHSPGAIVTSRLDQKSCSWRDGHWGDQVGFIEDYTINQNRKLEVGVMHSPHNPRAVILYKDYRDKYRKNTSARFIVRELKLDKTIDEVDYYRALKWELIHGAAVPDGADENVGVDRSLNKKNIYQLNNRSNTMDPITNPQEPTPVPTPAPVVDRSAVIAEEKKKEAMILKDRAKKDLKPEHAALLDRTFEANGPDAAVNAISIFDMVRSNESEFKDTPNVDLWKLAETMVKNGTRSEKMGDHITDLLCERQQKSVAKSFEGMDKKDFSGLSITRAIQSLLPNFDSSKVDRDLKIIREYCEANNISPVGPNGGMILPLELVRMKDRTLVTSTPTSAGNLVPTNLLASEFIPFNRNLSLADRLGVRNLPNLVGNQAVPTQTGAASGSWMTDEVTGPNASDLTTGQKTLQPKTYMVGAAFSRLSALNTNPAIEQITIDDVLAVANLGKDKALFHGTGTEQPLGLENLPLIGLGTAVPTPTFAQAVAMETSVKQNNLGSNGNFGYATTPGIAAYWKTNLKSAGVAGYIMENNLVNGYKVEDSNQITTGFTFFGAWNQAVTGEWGGGIELVIDPYTGKGTVINVYAYLTVDVMFRYAKAFAMYKAS